jgi:hypothetical protein
MRAICDTCGHTSEWHDRESVRARLRSDLPVERPCYREIGGAPCRCNGFRESGTFAAPAGSTAARGPAQGFDVFRVGVLTLLLIVTALGLLYAYRSQTPSIPEVSVTQAVFDISSGRVAAVTIAGNRATLEFRDVASYKEQTTLPEPDTILAKAVSDYNAANPSKAVALTYQQEGQTIGVVGSIVLSLLPVLLIGGSFYYLMMRARRQF